MGMLSAEHRKATARATSAGSSRRPRGRPALALASGAERWRTPARFDGRPVLARWADAILVILSMVDDALAKELMDQAAQYGMDALVETHDEDEVVRAVKLGADLLGVNNRNLRTFEVTLDTTLDLLPRVPAGRLLVTESGILARDDVQRMRGAGIHAFLVGEAFMRAPDPGVALAELFAA